MALNPYIGNRSELDPFYGSMALTDPFMDTFSPSLQQLQMQNRRNLANTMQSLTPFTPLLNTDLIESETDYHVHTDLPGVKQGDLDITCSDGRLVIKAERREVHEVDNDFVHRTERNFGKVQRTLSIPRNADVTNAMAKLENGVLTISFPKLEGVATSRKLLIN